MRTADLSKTTIAALHLVVHSHHFESLHHRNQSNRLALRTISRHPSESSPQTD
jgi:hypothetical protein